MKDIERRHIVELRVEDGESTKITGHAAVFDIPAEIWGFEEVVRKGAFTQAIKEDDVRALWNHDPNFVLGRTKSKTLKLSEDERGLLVDNDPPNTQWSKDLQVSMKRGDVDQMSYGFIVQEEKWTVRQGKPDLREILKARLFDVAVVTFPAFKETDAQVENQRSLALRNAPEEIKNKISNGGQGAPEDNNTEFDQVRKLKHMKMKII